MTVEFENQIALEELEVFDKQDQLNIYRICLEILNNLFKHSKCTQLRMVTQKDKDRIVFEFVHNGKGVNNEEMEIYTENSKGLGLKSLKARSLLLGATIDYLTSMSYSIIQLSVPYPV
jgi:signal transduction histidine kinase